MAIGENIWLSKHISGFLSTAKVMYQQKQWIHDKCPRCQHPAEDSEDIIRCQGTMAQEAWDQSITSFEQELNKIHANPIITKIIINELNKERGINKPTYIQTNCPINMAILEQQQI